MVRPGEVATHGAGLWAQPRRLKAGVRKRQKSSWRRETGCLQVQATAPLQMLFPWPGPQGHSPSTGLSGRLLRRAMVGPTGTWNWAGRTRKVFLKHLKQSLGILTSGQWTWGSYSQRRAALTVSSSDGKAEHSYLWPAGVRVIPATVGTSWTAWITAGDPHSQCSGTPRPPDGGFSVERMWPTPKGERISQ